MCDLEGPQQPFVEQFVRGQPGDIFASHGHTPCAWLKNARDDIEKGGLSGPIWANQSGDRPRLDRQACAINGMKPAKGFHQILYNDHA